jgi:hypothetical protein
MAGKIGLGMVLIMGNSCNQYVVIRLLEVRATTRCCMVHVVDNAHNQPRVGG